MKRRLMIAIGLILSMSALEVSAQSHRNLRDENRRISQGMSSGQLTAGETARLHSQKMHLKREALRYKKNDGHIGPPERADLRMDNRRLSRNIFRQKHDRQRRY